jgi:hypothetical protein
MIETELPGLNKTPLIESHPQLVWEDGGLLRLLIEKVKSILKTPPSKRFR